MTLKAKLHNVTVTHCEPDYDGSCAIDDEWLQLSSIQLFEQIHIYNKTNGERFITYAISADKGSSVISINGAAACKAKPGDKVIICAYHAVAISEFENIEPKKIYFDHENKITRFDSELPLSVS